MLFFSIYILWSASLSISSRFSSVFPYTDPTETLTSFSIMELRNTGLVYFTVKAGIQNFYVLISISGNIFCEIVFENISTVCIKIFIDNLRKFLNRKVDFNIGRQFCDRGVKNGWNFKSCSDFLFAFASCSKAWFWSSIMAMDISSMESPGESIACKQQRGTRIADRYALFDDLI